MPDRPVAVDPAELSRLFFEQPGEPGIFSVADRNEMPAASRLLLEHQHHMTVTVERQHGCRVDVEVLRELHQPLLYAREILLRRQTDQAPVLYGIVRLKLELLPADVVRGVLAKDLPLGRLLIEAGVLRRVQLLELLRVEPGQRLIEILRLGSDDSGNPPCYGRTAIIHVDSRPAIELLEIVPPV